MYRGGDKFIQGLVENPEKNRPLGKPKRRWEDNIKIGLPRRGIGGTVGLIRFRTVRDGGLL